MNAIVFDMEWNMGYQPRTFAYHGTEQVLRGEIIQIGAAKVNEAGAVQDTFLMNLRPRIFRKLQHRVAQVTGLTQQQVNAGVPAREALARFVAWCGPEASLIEWGLDDAPVLKQNLFINGMDETWPAHCYDLQRIFLAQKGRAEGEGMTLESVITRLGIPQERPFHDALADALYTADVCQKLDLAAGLAEYPSETEQLREALCTEQDADYRDFTRFGPLLEREDWRTDAAMRDISCPDCGQALRPDPDDVWLKRGNTGYYSEQRCAAHGPWLVRVKMTRRDGLHWQFARVEEKPDAAGQERWAKQKAAYLARLKKKSAAEAPHEAQDQAEAAEDGGAKQHTGTE